MTKFLTLIFILVIASGCSGEEDESYLFSYFTGNGEDGLYLAHSNDGLNWTSLNPELALLTPQVGKDKLMRDPCIILGGDGRFHMVWTVSWNERGIGYASSADLFHWSEQKYIPVMHHESSARNCWAPELFYDEQEKQYIIYWASTIPGRFPETDTTGDNGYNHRMYYTATKDFKNFSNTRLLFDQGFNVIDATIQKAGEEYVMFLKNETKYPQPEKNIRIAISSEIAGNYTAASEPITGNWVEGPTAMKTAEGWIVYFDMYTKHKMGAVFSADLKHWTDISETINFPEGARHGSIIKIRQSVYDTLIKSLESDRPN